MSAESHHITEEKIVDPIGVSLQATIADEHTAYRQPEKQHRDSLFDAKTLDIWQGGGQPHEIVHDYGPSRGLPPQLFDGSYRGERLVLRLLCTRPATAPNSLAWHDDLAKYGEKQISYLPFVPQAIEDLNEQWDLPRSWTWLRLNAREVGNFHRKTEWDLKVKPPKAVRIGVVVNFPFVLRPARQLDFLNEARGGKTAGRRHKHSDYNPWRDDPFIWSLVMSHSLKDGKTRGVLDGVTDFAFDDISRKVMSGGSRSLEHPLHVPYVLLNIVFEHAAWEINRLAIDVAEFEALSKDAETSSLEKFDAITTQLQYLRRSFNFQDSLTNFMKDTLVFIEDKALHAGEAAKEDSSSYSAHLHETNPQVEEKLTNLSFLIANNLSSCKYLQARTKDAMDYINAAISLRDNASNQEDADSNKVMSLLQLVFLPATAVAAVFSMNVFDWSKDPVQVFPSFWLFVIVTLVVATLVFLVYIGARRYDKVQEQKRKKDAEDRENHAQELLYQSPDGNPKSGARQRHGKRGHKDRGNRQDDSGEKLGKNLKPTASIV